MWQKIPKTFAFLFGLLFFFILWFGLFRLGFWLVFQKYHAVQPLGEILYAFWVGFRFDVQLAALVLLPVLLTSGVPYWGLFKSAVGKYFWLVYILLAAVLLTAGHVINIAHYDFFKKMADASLLRFLYDLPDAFRMVYEGYPLLPIVLALGLGLLISWWFLQRLYRHFALKHETKTLWPNTWSRRVMYVCVSCVYVFACYGKFELYPWRWSEAFYSNNSFVAALASNPVTYFVNTVKNTGEKYNLAKVRAGYSVVADYFGVKKPDTKTFGLVRQVVPDHAPEYTFDQPNIVLILGESTSYARTSISGNPLNPTPFLKHMSDTGLSYSRYYTPHAGTARGVWVALTGLPDVELVKTSSRNPMVVKQHMMLNDFPQYKKFYFIGGSLSWGNVRGVISNVEGVDTFEEQDYPNSPHNDVWGISDAHLAGEVHAVLKQQTEPFFAFVQLAGNHSPNTIPDENFGFTMPEEVDEEALLQYGFNGSQDELIGQRFLDHSVKRLITLAKQEAYFKNTIFIFVGDHGLSRRADHVHKAEQAFHTHTLHTPLIIYAPHLLTHKAIDHPVGAMDLMATIAGLTGKPYTNTTFGKDILSKNFDAKNHHMFYLEHGSGPMLYLMAKEHLFAMRADGEKQALHPYHFNGEEPEDIQATLPDKARQMRQLLGGLYEMMRYTRYHNTGVTQ